MSPHFRRGSGADTGGTKQTAVIGAWPFARRDVRVMAAACALQIPLPKIPAHVAVIRHGHRLGDAGGKPVTPGPIPSPGASATQSSIAAAGLFMRAGDRIRVSRPAVFSFIYLGNRYRIRHGRLRLQCANLRLSGHRHAHQTTILTVSVDSGQVAVSSGRRPTRAVVMSRELIAWAKRPRTDFVVDRNPTTRATRAWTLDRPIIAARERDPTLQIDERRLYTAISDHRRLRLDIWPFSISPD